jgi:hypothetical protein
LAAFSEAAKLAETKPEAVTQTASARPAAIEAIRMVLFPKFRLNGVNHPCDKLSRADYSGQPANLPDCLEIIASLPGKPIPAPRIEFIFSRRLIPARSDGLILLPPRSSRASS